MVRLWIGISLLAAALCAAPPALAWEDWPSEWRPGRPSVAGSSTGPASIDAAVFLLDVPFRTQKDGSKWQASNCGPASLGMVLDGLGIPGQATEDLRFRSHTYQGTVGVRTGTGLEHLARVAEDFGVSTHGLYDESGGFRSWTVDDARTQLRLGRPVMPLVRLHRLPGHEAAGERWGHYILLTGLDGDDFFYSDSLMLNVKEGVGRRITAAQLEQAMMNSHIPGQAVAFGGMQTQPLSTSRPEPARRL